MLADEGPSAAFHAQQCERLVDVATDGAVLGSWRLTFVNNRGARQDRVILLTQHCVLRINFNFATGKANHTTKLPIKDVEKVVIGPMVYQGEMAQAVAKNMTGALASQAAGHDCPRAVRIVMTDAFVAESGRGTGMLAMLSGKDKEDVKMCTLTQGDSKRGVEGFEAALRKALSDAGRAIVEQSDVLLSLSPVNVVVGAAVNDVKNGVDKVRGKEARVSVGTTYTAPA
jgi:hypothetical protein